MQDAGVSVDAQRKKGEPTLLYIVPGAMPETLHALGCDDVLNDAKRKPGAHRGATEARLYKKAVLGMGVAHLASRRTRCHAGSPPCTWV